MKLKETDAVFEVKHRHGNSVACFNCTHFNKSIIYVIMRKEKAPIFAVSRSRTLKTQRIHHYKHARKTRVLFLLYDTDVDFSSRNNYVESIIPWST